MIPRRARAILGDDHFGIVGVGDAVVSLGVPSRWAGTVLWDYRFGAGIRDAHVPLGVIAGWAGSIFSDRHYGHRHSKRLLKKRARKIID